MSAGLPLQGERELCSQKWQKNVRMLKLPEKGQIRLTPYFQYGYRG